MALNRVRQYEETLRRLQETLRTNEDLIKKTQFELEEAKRVAAAAAAKAGPTSISSIFEAHQIKFYSPDDPSVAYIPSYDLMDMEVEFRGKTVDELWSLLALSNVISYWDPERDHYAVWNRCAAGCEFCARGVFSSARMLTNTLNLRSELRKIGADSPSKP